MGTLCCAVRCSNDRQAEVAPITATQAEAGPGPSAGGAAAPSGSSADYSSWPIKELRRFLQERAVVGCHGSKRPLPHAKPELPLSHGCTYPR